MGHQRGSDIANAWPEESREAARLLIDTYGEPHEATPSLLIWYGVGPWKRAVASRVSVEHLFPVPHHDSVESVIDYWVPLELFTPLARFDGSVSVARTVGEVSARCHDERSNFLALNLMHDLVTGERDVDEARAYYAKEFLDARRGLPTPYLEKLRFQPGGQTADPDARALSGEELRRAVEEGERRAG